MSTSSPPCVRQPQVRPILVHDGEALDPVLFRAGLVDEDHAAVEIAFLAGKALVNRIRDDMRQAPRRVRRNVELLACDLAAGVDIPKPVLAFQPAIARVRDAADDKRLSVKDPPILKLRRGIHARDPLDERCGIDGLEEAGAIQVRRDDLRDLTREAAAGELRDGDRDCPHLPAPDLNLDLRRSVVRNQSSSHEARRRKKKWKPRAHVFMSAAIHVAWIETENHVPAAFILLRRNEVGLAANRGADGRVGHGLVGW